jgi:hypothetical protein
MKSLLVLCASLLVSVSSFAENFYGQVVSAPSTIKVVDDSGATKEYAITSILNTGSINSEFKMISMSQNGLMARCGDYLGQLAADFTLTIHTAEGAQKTATVQAASGEIRKVSVFGMCQVNSNVLTQLQIDVKTGEGPQAK